MNTPDQNPEKDPSEISPLDYFKGKSVGVSAKIESEQEMLSRLKREEETHSLKLKLNFFTSIGAILLVSGVSLLCTYVIITGQNDKKWAETTLTVIVSGFIGYLSGKNKSSSE
jgi:hypothetical protein